MSHYESFDPKPLAPSAYRGEFKPISTSLPGIQFSEHVPLLAARANKFNVLRSVYVDSPSHPVAIHQTLTGWDLPGADVDGKNRNTTHPSIGSWVARLRAENRRRRPFGPSPRFAVDPRARRARGGSPHRALGSAGAPADRRRRHPLARSLPS